MPPVYYDSSALMKLVVVEKDSEIVTDLWESGEWAAASRLAYPEVRAALAAASRRGLIDGSALSQAMEKWEKLWAATWAVELSRRVEQLAGDLAQTHGLRGADAVHLASALAAARGSALVFASWDRKLQRAARAAGLSPAPPEI